MKRIIFSEGGKGGVGKSVAMIALVEYYLSLNVHAALFDMDTENKTKGSLQHFFPAEKVNINTEGALDILVDALDKHDVVIADFGASAGEKTFQFFDEMVDSIKETFDVMFVAVGVVTDDPASTESVLQWADRLQDRVSYLIIENSLNRNAQVHYWLKGKQAAQFRKALDPVVIEMEHRHADLENAARNHGLSLGRIAGRQTDVPELSRTAMVLRAAGYQKRLFAEFDKARRLLVDA